MRSINRKVINLVTCLVVVLSFSAQARVPAEGDYDRWVEAWDSLVPSGAYDFVPQEMTYELFADPLFNQQVENASRVLNFDLADKQIELAGYMVPITFDGERVSQFLLVPEAGQCIHVPAPPPNQTIFVDLGEQYTELRDLYDPIIVNGTLTLVENSFELADSGYTLIDASVDNLDYGS